ncbi:MAG: hypothetical protein DMG40_15325 [Acidobacteria bacterium]|nr:MAG: hypothetical protein DMG40_15325 [Acidobacteriota bacterium]
MQNLLQIVLQQSWLNIKYPSSARPLRLPPGLLRKERTANHGWEHALRIFLAPLYGAMDESKRPEFICPICRTMYSAPESVESGKIPKCRNCGCLLASLRQTLKDFHSKRRGLR